MANPNADSFLNSHLDLFMESCMSWAMAGQDCDSSTTFFSKVSKIERN